MYAIRSYYGQVDDFCQRQSLPNLIDGMVMVADGIGNECRQVPFSAEPGPGLAVIDLQFLFLEKGEPGVVTADAF